MRATFERILVYCLLLASAHVGAQDAAAWRGAWIADVGAERIVLYLVLQGSEVSGTYCFDCTDPDHLSFVDDGVFDSGGLHFNLYLSSSNGSYSVIPTDARLDGSELHLTLKRPESEASSYVMRRGPPQVPRAPAAAATPNPAPVRVRELPGPAEVVTPDTVAGLWLSGAGPTKQYFIFKRHKDGVRGLVCGPCTDARTFAPLENINMSGTNFHFDIMHEDNGIGFEEHGPFRNITDAQVSLNEMQMTTVNSFDPNGRKFEMTLLGPTRYMPPVQP